MVDDEPVHGGARTPDERSWEDARNDVKLGANDVKREARRCKDYSSRKRIVLTTAEKETQQRSKSMTVVRQSRGEPPKRGMMTTHVCLLNIIICHCCYCTLWCVPIRSVCVNARPRLISVQVIRSLCIDLCNLTALCSACLVIDYCITYRVTAICSRAKCNPNSTEGSFTS
jgi:hypothetical protein